MGSVSATLMLPIFIFLSFFVLSGSAGDSIIQGSWLWANGSTLVSQGGTFELGFFTPPRSPFKKPLGRYVGIWYRNLNEKGVVWVANREPILDKNPSFGISDEISDRGSLMARGNNGPVVYLYPGGNTSRVVKLIDSGNLVLTDTRTGKILWESFRNPTDTFLPGMIMDENLTLISWMSPENPKAGPYSFVFNQKKKQYEIIWAKLLFGPYWNNKDSEGAPDNMQEAILSLLSNSNASGKSYGERLVMSSSGQIQYYTEKNRNSSLVWSAPRDRCSASNACGKSGSCNVNNAVMCKCLPGFKPDSPSNWSAGEFSGGCTRKSSLCENGGNLTFLSLKMMNVQPLGSSTDSEGGSCRETCLKNCQCQAYAEDHTTPGKCLIWTDDPKTLQEEYDDETYELFVRIPVSDIESTARNCEACGSNMIPYPLSTRLKCGDPMYYNFECNNTTGQVLFRGPDGSYRVTRINPETLTFVIQLKGADKNGSNCSSPSFVSQIPRLNRPFHTRCNASNVFKTDNSISSVALENSVEVEISWDPPPEPRCNSSEDCKDWPNSSCRTTQYKESRCLCHKNFRWSGQSLNCTQEHGKKVSLAIVVGIPAVVALVVVLGTIGFIVYLQIRTITKRKGKMENQGHHLNYSESRVKQLVDSEQFEENDKKGIDVPFFDLGDILAATDSFSDANKLGEGGFGPVYKGKFPGGQEMAIKRLSRGSRQGLQEYKNEVVLIAKLQHRNLVRLLGYCIEGDEKILLYEYLPNKSLDSFIFDPKPCMLLNWERRFDIILGIARGLLYLHQDSRLKIIHRDLKTSNVLLDNEMNPKISDFGLARIFDSKQVEASTNRVVGTYGYMSPEYALDGYFSEKSDVFSFGVMVLEIISGKRNTRIYHSDQALSLLGYTWKLWKEDSVLELMDQTLTETCNTDEFIRCVNVGLLCVQDDPIDRPTMGVALVMLSSDIVRMPVPKQPAFVVKRDLSSTASSSTKLEASWKSEILDSIEEGR